MSSHGSHPSSARVVGVLGASGGLGTSTLAVALAVVAARDGRLRGRVPAVVADGAVAGGGLDVTACVEHVPGLRWSDLAGTRGDVSGPDLADQLPVACATRVLSAVPGGPQPPPEVVRSVLAALRATADLVVVDLSRSEGAPPLVDACDGLLLVAGSTPRHLSDVVAVHAALPAEAGVDIRLVLRGGGATGELAAAVADHLQLPLAGRWPDDGRVVRDATRGQTPGASRRSSLAGLCRSLLDDLRGGAPEVVRTDRGAA
jgi:secretion/DNA translocation related CpaE-like protein